MKVIVFIISISILPVFANEIQVGIDKLRKLSLLPVGLEFKSSLPEDTLDLEAFQKERSRLDKLADKKRQEYVDFDLQYVLTANKVKAAIKTLESIDDIASARPNEPKVLEKKEQFLQQLGLSKEQLKIALTQLNELLEKRNSRASNFQSMVAKQKNMMRFKISLLGMQKILKGLKNSFSDCEISMVKFDETSKRLSFEVKTIGENLKSKKKSFTISSRLPIVFSQEDQQYVLQFSRDALLDRGNLEIADAEFDKELTKIKVYFQLDGAADSMFFQSLSPVTSNSSSSFLSNVLSTFNSGIKKDSGANFIGCTMEKEEGLPSNIFVNNVGEGLKNSINVDSNSSKVKPNSAVEK